MEIGIAIAIIIGLLIIFVISIYNRLVALRNRVKESWAQVDVQLKKRFDVVPNLVATVQGYATHEKTTLDAVIEARSGFANAKSPKEEMDASNMLTATLGKLFALSEAYPDLKANQNFLRMQEDLSSIENEIATARSMYNDYVRKFNNKVEQFPSNVIASSFKFEAATFFDIPEVETAAPKVEFTSN